MATLQDYQGILLNFLIIIFTANALFLIVGGFTGVDLINGAESFSFLPREVTALNLPDVNGTTILDVNASASISTQSDPLQIPYWDQTVSNTNNVLSAISNLFFTGYVGVLNLIGMPTEIQFVIITVISIIQIFGFLALMIMVIQSLPIIGSGT